MTDFALTKRGQALDGVPFLMVSDADHVTGLAGLADSVVATASRDNGEWEHVSGSCHDCRGGAYTFDAPAWVFEADTLWLKFSAPTADDYAIPFSTLQEPKA